MTFVITQACCNDASCVPACPVNCIHPTPDEPGFTTSEMLYIDPDSCVECGLCVDPCPVDAIVWDSELTKATERYAEINARYYKDPDHRNYPGVLFEPTRPRLETAERGPLQVAIVGSGPAGCYAAEELLARRELGEVEVHMFERVPTPWGLVRFGVAPDHQYTKLVTQLFTQTAQRPGFTLHLNVEVGTHLSHQELLEHHHAVLYAVGASSDRTLDIPGEDLPGCHSATDFVAWYNGHPEFAAQTFDLSGERAVIVGNGNVALDVARILASDVDQLARTDIADHALEALAASRISEVVVLGRRGPAQAAYTTPELLGLTATPGIDVIVEPGEASLDALSLAALDADPHSIAHLKVEIVRELAHKTPQASGKRILLRYLASPVEVLGPDRVNGLRVSRNELVATATGRLDAAASGDTIDIRCGLVLRSVGYKSAALAGLPFDDARSTLHQQAGRVVDPSAGKPIPGVYTAGWIKRGPSGVIGTNKTCAAETVHAILEDYAADRLPTPTNDTVALRELIAHRQPLALDLDDWKAIDRYEQATGKGDGRPRIKLTEIRQLLDVAQSARKAR